MSSSSISTQSAWSLKNQKYVVTGGTKGIGYATAKALLTHGANVLVCARTESDITICVENLQNESNRIGNDSSISIYGIACDISTEEGRKNLLDYAKKVFDSELNGLINNVGRNIRKPISEQTSEEYRSIQSTNVDSIYFLCQLFQPVLKKTAEALTGNKTTVVVNVTSAAGVQSSGTGAAYGMSKASIIHLTKILACEWAPHKIRVNAVAPWMTMTPMLEEAVKEDPSQLDKVIDWTPMQRLATVEEVAGPIAFLCMDCSGYITGQCLGIDGGLTAQGFQGPCATGS